MKTTSEFDFLILDPPAEKLAAAPPPKQVAPASQEFVCEWGKMMDELRSIPNLGVDRTPLPVTELAWILFLSDLVERRQRSQVLRSNWSGALDLAVRKFFRFCMATAAPKNSEEIRAVTERFIALVRKILGDAPTKPTSVAAAINGTTGTGGGAGRRSGESHKPIERQRGG